MFTHSLTAKFCSCHTASLSILPSFLSLGFWISFLFCGLLSCLWPLPVLFVYLNCLPVFWPIACTLDYTFGLPIIKDAFGSHPHVSEQFVTLVGRLFFLSCFFYTWHISDSISAPAVGCSYCFIRLFFCADGLRLDGRSALFQNAQIVSRSLYNCIRLGDAVY